MKVPEGVSEARIDLSAEAGRDIRESRAIWGDGQTFRAVLESWQG